MTDMEMAEDYAKNNHTLICCDCNYYNSQEDIEEAFLAGLKAARQEKWHDLRINSKDLPNGYKTVLNQAGKITNYDPNRGFLGLDGVGVIAWCEIPTFTDNKLCLRKKQKK